MRSTKTLTLFGFFALTASMLMSADEYPAFAQSGLQAVFFLIVGGVLWFLPVALCSAELATVDGWEEGGVFAWVGNTLGQRIGFVAVFFQWLQITVGFVTMLYFILGSVSYMFDFPALNQNPLYKLIGFIILYWLATFFQLFGIGKTAGLVKICFIVGIIVPAVFQILLALHYAFAGGELQIAFDAKDLIPTFSGFGSLVAFLPFILAYTGIEASASHINEMKNPRRDYPLTLLCLVIFAILLDSLGGLSVAAVVPASQLSLNTGVVQALTIMLDTLSTHLGWLVKVVAGLMALGMLGEISSWIVGPVRGLYTTAKTGILPGYFNRLNKNDVPLRLVIAQGVVVTVFGILITFFGGGSNGSYALAISLTVMIYLVVYLLIFCAYINLKITKDSLMRGFRIHGGRVAGIFVAGIGLTVSLLSFILTFFPTTQTKTDNPILYMAVLGIGFIVALAIPLLIYRIAESRRRIEKTTVPTSHFLASEANEWIFPKARGEHHFRERGHSREKPT